jgi:hypothetical protein
MRKARFGKTTAKKYYNLGFKADSMIRKLSSIIATLAEDKVSGSWGKDLDIELDKSIKHLAAIFEKVDDKDFQDGFKDTKGKKDIRYGYYDHSYSNKF